MKLSDLKVGDKFRWAGESCVYELICIRVRGTDGATEWAYWNAHTGFHMTIANCGVELITDPPEPRYRPFANAEEFAPHRDRWIKRQDQDGNLVGGCFKASWYGNKGIHHELASFSSITYEELAKYQFDDGTPCGELVE